MAKGKVARVTVRGELRWCLDLGKIQDPDGVFRRQRLFFPTRPLAEAERDSRKELAQKDAEASKELPQSVVKDALAAWRLLGPYGRTLTEAATFLLANARVKHPGTTVLQAVEIYLDRFPEVQRKTTYYMTIRARLLRLSDQTKIEHVRALASYKAKKAKGEKPAPIPPLPVPFAEEFGTFPLAEAVLKRDAVKTWLEKNYKHPLTRNLVKDQLRTAFRWWQKEGYVSKETENVFAVLERAEVPKKSVGVFKPEALRKLIETAAYGVENEGTGEVKSWPELVPWLCIGAFSGVRREELEQLTADQVRMPELIHVPVEIAKMGEGRDIPINDTLKAWLLAFPLLPGQRLWPTNGRKKLDALRLAAGVEWVDNGLRHSFGSYRYASVKNKEQVAQEMRHEDVATFEKFYCNRGITEAAAKEYWAILPPKMAPILALTA
ncbi:hypothetical protein SAMN05444156_2332 [Verrucomicrobium sp. GAS474]|uniref:site-specific integrase n=1 Tax=Verrucomicrobium sp. GAS474 TaxID=1882831 RepID=UPI00087D5AC3|nr:site-specific integrase [Verrucomicrobium sp. GAS474]SDU16140.1 hypothetical protein SAMN05444156_2332 [Verrucomicrobium sp. GAS474]